MEKKNEIVSETHLISDSKKHAYCQVAVEIEGDARFMYLRLGEMLYNISHERLYEPFWSSWQEYCMEFKDFSIGSISKLVSIYETYVLKYGYKPDDLVKAGGWTKLYSLIPNIKSKKDAEHWLSLAKSSSRSDLEKFLVEAKTGVSMQKCKHPNSYVIVICPDCGEKRELYREADGSILDSSL